MWKLGKAVNNVPGHISAGYAILAGTLKHEMTVAQYLKKLNPRLKAEQIAATAGAFEAKAALLHSVLPKVKKRSV